MDKRLFISHAVEDTAVAQEFVKLLENGMNIPKSEIFFSSNPEQGISPGLDFVESIRMALGKCEAYIGLITPSFFSSDFCMCELGAIWGASKPFYPILIPPMDYDQQIGVLVNKQAVRGNDRADLDVFYDSVCQHILGSRNSSTSQWNKARDEFISSLSAYYRKLTEEKIEDIKFLNNYIFNIANSLNQCIAPKSSKRNKEAYFVVFDIDKMSQVNKLIQPHNGDRILQLLADYIKRNRQGRYILGGRCGDDTFYTLFWGTQRQAKSLCTHFIEQVREAPVKLGLTVEVTASGAVSRFDGAASVADVITSANKALKEARRKNGNRVELGEDPDPSIEHDPWSS